MLLAGGVAALGLSAGCAGDWSVAGKKVLFVGNSFTDYNGGLDSMLESLAPHTGASRIAPGGSTLQQHASSPAVASALSKDWDFVVLQEQSQYPILAPTQFSAGASALVAKVRAAGATPILLATWGRPDSPSVTSAALDAAYRSLGDRLVVKVIPAGRAFAGSTAARPGLPLNQSDGHPTKAGTYLAACTAYAVLYGRTPVGNSSHASFSADVAGHLQRIAAMAAGF